MPFKKGLSKYLKNTIYKYSPASRPIKNNYYIPHSYTLAPIRRDNNFKPITTSKTIKNI